MKYDKKENQSPNRPDPFAKKSTNKTPVIYAIKN